MPTIEPILQENKNRFVIFPIKHQDIWEFYKKDIYPFKGKLEQWYQENISFYTDFMIIFLTAWVIVFPESELVYKVFKGLPKRAF